MIDYAVAIFVTVATYFNGHICFLLVLPGAYKSFFFKISDIPLNIEKHYLKCFDYQDVVTITILAMD